MKHRSIIILVVLFLVLAAYAVFLRGDTVVQSTECRSGRMRAQLVQTPTGLIGKSYQLHITNVPSGFSFVEETPQFDTVPDSVMRHVRMHWHADTTLVVEVPNGPVRVVYLTPEGMPF